MAKYYGKVGYAVLVNSENDQDLGPDICKEEIKEFNAYGDILQDNRRLQNSQYGTINDDITVSNRLSIVASPYIVENFYNIRYATWMNVRWKVTEVQVQYPRLILSLGGVYNGEQAKSE